MRLVCRGQAVPESKELVCELFVDEVIEGPEPTLYAAVLGTVDGQPALHSPRLALQLRPAWPIDDDVQLLDDLAKHVDPTPVASVGGIDAGYRALVHAALGKPSDSFGELYRPLMAVFCGHCRRRSLHVACPPRRWPSGTGEPGWRPRWVRRAGPIVVLRHEPHWGVLFAVLLGGAPAVAGSFAGLPLERPPAALPGTSTGAGRSTALYVRATACSHPARLKSVARASGDPRRILA
jgi:hypothetical protein